MTDIVLAPTRNAILLARQAATLDQVSGGRFTLGIGVGAREDDFTVTGADFHTRGKRLDEMLDLMHLAWRGEQVLGAGHPVTPRPVNGRFVPTAFAGSAEAEVRRVAQYGVGYTLGGGTPESLAGMMERVNQAWQAAGREGKPKFWALGYFAFGDEVAAEAQDNIEGYYGEFGKRVWARAVKTRDDARARVKMFDEVGCDEYIFFMTAPSVEQAERLAEAVF